MTVPGPRSMTGFGRGEALCEAGRIIVEVRSVNHRFAEVAVKVPTRYAPLEPRLRKMVTDRVARGRVDLSLSLQAEGPAGRGPAVDWAVAEGLRARLEELKARLGLPGEIDVALLASQRGVLASEEPTPELPWEPVETAAGRALDGLLEMRAREGAALLEDLAGRMARLAGLVGEIAERAPLVPREYRERLAARVRALLGGGQVQVDPGRLEQEVALLADRADVTEELTRLRSHLGQIESLLAAATPAGRKLEFLLQEVHREVNTIGSKSADLAITGAVLSLKAELEKLREQVANIE